MPINISDLLQSLNKEFIFSDSLNLSESASVGEEGALSHSVNDVLALQDTVGILNKEFIFSDSLNFLETTVEEAEQVDFVGTNIDAVKIDYNDPENPASNFLRSSNIPYRKNFFNEPLEGLLTINNHKASFTKTWNKTHTSMTNRKASIKVEITHTDGSKELLDIGDFLVKNIKIASKDKSVTIALDDLANPLIQEPADDIRSGFQWYRNVPVKFLVEELVKKKYFDHRSGEIPRDFIIDGIRPKNFNNEQVLSSLGKPPTFTRLSSDNDGTGVCRVLLSADLDGDGKKLYLGINNFLWQYDEITAIYNLIGKVSSFSGETFNIKKLWFNSKDNHIYGVAWPEEELVHIEEITHQPWNKFSCPIGNEFILFRANLTNFEVLFDSSNPQDFSLSNGGFVYKLFSGEFHIVPPYFVGKIIDKADYQAANGNYWPPYPNYSINDNKIVQIISGIGYFQDQINDLPYILKGTTEFHYPQTDNIAIPFAQKIGLMCNRTFENYAPTLYQTDGSGIQRFGHNLALGDYNLLTATNTSFVNRVNLISLNSLNQNPERTPFGNVGEGFLNSRFFILKHHNQFLYNGALPLNIYSNVPFFDGYLPSINYEQTHQYDPTAFINGYGPWIALNESTHYLPQANLINKKFNPGYLAYFEEATSYFQMVNEGSPLTNYFWYDNSFEWNKVAWPWLKYTSGQVGSVEFLPNYGNKGGIFFSVYVNPTGVYQASNPTKYTHRCMIQSNITSVIGPTRNTTDANPLELSFKYIVYDIETGTFSDKMNLSNDLVRTTNGKEYPFQLTAVKAHPDTNELYCCAVSFTNKNTKEDSNPEHMSHFFKLTFTGTGPLDVSYTNLFTGGADPLQIARLKEHVWTEILILENSLSTKKFALAGYNKKLILNSDDFTDTPDLGKCFFVETYEGIDSFINLLELNIFQYKNFIHSSTEQAFYYLIARDRTEDSTGLELWKAEYNDGFNIINQTLLGTISDVAFGESNNLSNLEVIQYGTDPEVIYGISSAYYNNPINKNSSRNYLWKFDIYLSGIIELADFSGLKIWDAITQLAQGFNYVAGFSGSSFFFLPKGLSDTPDIIFDLDNDPVLSHEKILEENVENIITAVPYRAIKKEIEWSIILVNNDTIQNGHLVNDFGRTKIDAALRIRQDDDLTKDIILRTISKGDIPPLADGSQTSLRMAYLIYQNTIETQLIRDVESSETVIYIPSFFGDSFDTQLGIGDIFAIHDVDPDTGETSYLTRLITDINFVSNQITLESPLGKRFDAFTPVSIFRSFSTNGSDLRNNSWSNEGVTYLKGTAINVVSSTERSVDVASIRNLGIGTVIRFGNLNQEYKITSMEEKNETSGFPRIYFESYKGSLISGDLSTLNLTNAVVRAYWIPQANELVEVGGSKVFLGFEPGSTGTFWINSKGYDRIEINCPGLVLESDNNSKITVVDRDSIDLFGRLPKSLDDNRFIQINLLQYLARNYLHWNSKPKLIFNLENVIQAVSQGGQFYSIPSIKLLNTSTRKLFNVRIISREYLPHFQDFAIDSYILDHGFNLKTFTQTLRVRQIDAY